MPETIEFRVTALEKEFQRFDAQNSKTHKEFYDTFKELQISNALNQDHYTALKASIDSIALDVRILREKPAKAVDSLWKSIVSAIGGAIGAALIYLIATGVLSGV